MQSLVKATQGEDLKTVTAGKNGEYIPFSFYDVKKAEPLMEEVKKLGEQNWEIDFSGSFFSNKQMLNELVVILLISILLMYFILAAQFESFLQPLIVLIEIPIDVAASLLVTLDLRTYDEPDECHRYRGNLRYHCQTTPS